MEARASDRQFSGLPAGGLLMLAKWRAWPSLEATTNETASNKDYL